MESGALPTQIITDGSTERAGHAPKVVLPAGAQVFAERAARLEQLSKDHPLSAYLALIGRVCCAQAAALPARTAPRPVASVVRLGGAQANLRYLVYAPCSSEWNMVRVKCSACEEDKGVAYLSIAQDGRPGADAPVRAEACDECRTCLKILYQENDPLLDAMGDDLAMLSLDFLVDDQGYRRSGPNFLLHPGSSG